MTAAYVAVLMTKGNLVFFTVALLVIVLVIAVADARRPGGSDE